MYRESILLPIALDTIPMLGITRDDNEFRSASVLKKIVNSSEFQTLKMDKICIENECLLIIALDTIPMLGITRADNKFRSASVLKKIVNSSEFQTLKMDEICIENEC